MILRQGLVFGFFMLLILLLPGTLLNYYSLATSMMLGVTFFCAIFLSFCISKPFHRFLINKRFLIYIILFFLLISLHMSFVYNSQQDMQRFFLSLILLLGMTLSAYFFCILSCRVNNFYFNNLILRIYKFLILLAFISIFLINFQLVKNKSMIFFFRTFSFRLSLCSVLFVCSASFKKQARTLIFRCSSGCFFEKFNFGGSFNGCYMCNTQNY
jgi:hypothetical protein